MRVLFWGTPDFAVKSLKALIESNHQVVGVITQPDKPKGRGQKIQPTLVKEKALKHNIPVFQPEKIKNNQEFLEMVKKLNPDISVVVAYGKILPEEIINIPKYKTINVHASLLPEYRGAAPIQRAIMEGKDKTGVCIMEIIKELDAGDVYACKEVEITEDDDIMSLHDKLAEEGAKLLIEVLDKIEKGEIDKKPQNHEKATYAKPIEKAEGKIDFSRSAKEIFNQIRALKVMQIRSVEFGAKYGVKIHVRSSFNDEEGTWIVEENEEMEKMIVRGISHELKESRITVVRVPDKPGVAAKLFKALGDRNIVVDMIVQNVSHKGFTDISFTVNKTDADIAEEIAKEVAQEIGAEEVDRNDKIAKVSIVGLGMKTHAGTAAKMFEVLSKEGINIYAISTSEIKISVLIDEKYAELAVRSLHEAFIENMEGDIQYE